MRTTRLGAFGLLALLLIVPCALATDEPSPQLKALSSRIEVKVSQGKKTEAELAVELKALDAMLAKHRGEKTEDVAFMLFLKARVYDTILTNKDTLLINKAKAEALDAQLKRDFPDFNPMGEIAGNIAESVARETILLAVSRLANSDREANALKVREALQQGTKFPDFAEKDIAGAPLSIGQFKGQVVLLDFWATWCGPCVRELPNVVKAYKAHHKHGLEVISVSLDDDAQKLAAFTKAHHMPWPQYCDGLMWQNKLAVKYGVTSIPATYLLDGQGNIIAKNLRGEELEEKVAEALAKK